MVDVCMQWMSAIHTPTLFNRTYSEDWGSCSWKKWHFRSCKVFPPTNGKLSPWNTTVACSWCNFPVLT